MRSPVATVLLFVLVSCASSDGFIDQQTNECAPGQPVSIQAGFDTPSSGGREMIDDRLQLLVEVANNSSDDIVVKFVRADPSQAGPDASLQLQGGYRKFDETVAEGDAHVFEVPMTMRVRDLQRNRDPFSGAVDVGVTVGLADGQSYHCRFRVPVRF